MFVPETHDLDLVCVADANPAPSVTWFKNDHSIGGHYRGHGSEYEKRNKEANGKDEEEEEEDEDKKLESFTYIDNKVVSNLKNYKKNDDDGGSLDTNINKNKNKNNNKNNNNNNKYYEINNDDNTLSIQAVTTEEGGYYGCVVENGVGSVRVAVKVVVTRNGEKNSLLIELN